MEWRFMGKASTGKWKRKLSALEAKLSAEALNTKRVRVEAPASALLALLQWVVSMSPTLRIVVWIVIIGLCIDIVWCLPWTTSWSRTAKIFASILVSVLIGVFAMDHLDNRSIYQGYLSPGSDPSPKSPCRDMPANAFSLFYGNSASYATSFPYTVLEVKGKPKIILMKNAHGDIALKMDVFDKQEDIVAQIENNEFLVNPRKTFDIKSDKNHLAIIIDRQKEEVFNMTYLNPHAIKIKAVLHYPGSEESAIITDDVVFLGTNIITENCFHDRGGLHLGEFTLN
jgi:hypothetical protein